MNTQKKLISFLILQLLFFSFSYGQSILFNKIDQSNGLSNGRVNTIAKDHNGFVWIGTNNGLNRYDGNQFKIYNKQNGTLKANVISDILVDRRKRIWIATQDGSLNLYNQAADKFISFRHNAKVSNSIPTNHINTIFQDKKGNIWLGTENGLCLFNEKTKSFVSFLNNNSENSVSYNKVHSIYEDSNGQFWIGTFGGGLNVFNPRTKKFEAIKSTKGIFSNFIHTISNLNDDILLIGTSGNGLLQYDKKSGIFSNYLKTKLNVTTEISVVRSVFKDSRDNLWIGTDGHGVYKVQYPNSSKPIVHNYQYNPQLKSSLSGNGIYEITEDENSTIWIGTAWNGINIINPNSDYSFLFSDISGENTYPVLSIFKKDENLFLGLDGNGLNILETRTNKLAKFNKQKNSFMGGNFIQYIKADKEDWYWIGTFSNGLVHFNSLTKEYKQYRHQNNDDTTLSYNDVRQIEYDSNGNLWIATWGGGLNFFDIKSHDFTVYRANENLKTALNCDNVVSIQKEGNNLWLGTYDGGVNYFDAAKKTFTHFVHQENNPNSISSNKVNCIYKDSKHNLWIGTAGDGINVMNLKTRRINRFNDKEVRFQNVSAIVEDNNGVIWFSTLQGIFNFNYKTKEFKNLPALAAEYRLNSIFKDKEGKLYFGNTNGVVSFDPSTISFGKKAPEVKLTNFKLFNKEVAIGPDEVLKKSITIEDRIVLKHDLDVITFEFAALKYPFSANCEYSIKMENFDKEWRNIGRDRTITYTNLPSGSYIFKVKSKEIGAEWGTDYTAVNITILKPFWLQWWAFAIYAVLIVLIFYLFRKYIVMWEQMETKLKLEKVTHEKDIEFYNFKQQFFMDISHEIRTPVTLILVSINKIIKEGLLNAKELNSFNIIKKNSSHLIQLVNELLDLRKIEYNEIKLNVEKADWKSFCEEVYSSFSEMALEKNINFTIVSFEEAVDVWIDKVQMEKVLYNLLSNAFKFTQHNGEIKLKLYNKSNSVQIIVEDNGLGIPNEQLANIFNRFYQSENSAKIKELGFGLGLSIAKEIIQLHQGTIAVESKEQEGTQFIVSIPKGNAHFSSQVLHTYISGEEKVDYIIDKQNEKDNSTIFFSDQLAELNGQTILIVEDNEDIRNYIIELISKNCKYLEADNGESGLEIALKEIPDLIISDIMMPIMDGITLTKKIKTNMLTSHIPVILLTARASTANRVEGYDTGADDYITKPFNEILFYSRVKNLLNNRRLLRQRYSKENLVLPTNIITNETDQKFLEKMIKLIHDNISQEEFSAGFIAAELGMSHSVIYKKIKANTGMSIVEFVRDYKLKIFKKLIEEEGFTVTNACYYLGYSDRKYFSKLFKQKFGRNPSEFVKNRKTND